MDGDNGCFYLIGLLFVSFGVGAITTGGIGFITFGGGIMLAALINTFKK